MVAGVDSNCEATFSFLRNAVNADAATDTIGDMGIDTTGAVATETTVSAALVDSDTAVVTAVGTAAPRTGRRWIGMGDLTAEDASCCCCWAAAAAAANDS